MRMLVSLSTLGYDLTSDFIVDKTIYDSSTGFQAVGLKATGDGNDDVLLLRGTEPKKEFVDVWQDFHPTGVGYRQFTQNWDAVKSWLSGLTSPADIVGHSLGGALAQWIAAKFTSDDIGGKIDQLVTFNSPGIRQEEADAFDPYRAGEVVHHVVNGDLVTMAGEAYVRGPDGQPRPVRMASYSDLNIVNKHVLPLLVPRILPLKSGDETRLQPIDLEWREFDSCEELSSPWYHHTSTDYYVFLFAVGLFSPASAAALAFRGSAEAERELLGEFMRLAPVVYVGQNSEGNYVATWEGGFGVLSATTFTLAPEFDWEVDDGDPPMLRFDGGLSLDVGGEIEIELPSWLGGSFTASHLLDLADLDLNGEVNRNHLFVEGRVALLADVASLSGQVDLDGDRGELNLVGALECLEWLHHRRRRCNCGVQP